jgi:hypothetical protein
MPQLLAAEAQRAELGVEEAVGDVGLGGAELGIELAVPLPHLRQHLGEGQNAAAGMNSSCS